MAAQRSASSRAKITVAVRIRPSNERQEVFLMDGKTVIALNPFNNSISGDQPKAFTFDYAYWSLDGFEVDANGYRRPVKGSTYADQERIFNDIGRQMVDDVMQGYNSTVFAYGQAGSGKSYTIMGDQANRGLMPRTCEALFQSLKDSQSSGVDYEAKLSMLEIYNEKVQDLLSDENWRSDGLKVRGSLEVGFYVDGLTYKTVTNINEVEHLINEGNSRRVVASTKLNELSNRSHTIVTVTISRYHQSQNAYYETAMNFVDLAGSERQSQTGSTGDRFTEAKSINLSLSTLGNVISDLADNRKTTRYRESVLTKLLMNSLGGNCRTTMIATISPDAENYEQSLSTLRYADRVKRIKTDPRVNLIDIKAKNSTQAPQGGQPKSEGYSEEYIEKLKQAHEKEMSKFEESLRNAEQRWKRELAEARYQAEVAERIAAELRRRNERNDSTQKRLPKEEKEKPLLPYLCNLNEDPALSHKLCHVLSPGTMTVGRDGMSEIVVFGPGIVDNHAEFVISEEGRTVTLVPRDGDVLYNGQRLVDQVELVDGDRIRFGSNSFFLYRNPLASTARIDETDTAVNTQRLYTYQDAQAEIVVKSHADLKADIDSDNESLKDELIQIIPMVYSVNAIVKEMKRNMEFSAIVVSHKDYGLGTNGSRVYINIINKNDGYKYLWSKEKFLRRYPYILNMYETFQHTGKVLDVGQEGDPLWEPPDLEQLVGTATVPLDCVANSVSLLQTRVEITDVLSNSCGHLILQIVPVDKNGKEMPNAIFPVDPRSLIGKPLTFRIKIHQVVDLPPRFNKVRCQYRFYKDDRVVKTEELADENPVFNHDSTFHIQKVDKELVEYLLRQSLVIEVYGKQGKRFTSASQTARSTKSDVADSVDVLRKKLRTINRLSRSPLTGSQ